MKNLIFKIVLTIFVASMFSACGDDEIDRSKYALDGTTNSTSGTDATSGSDETAGTLSSALAPVSSTFAQDIVFFNIREIDEPIPVQETSTQSNSVMRKADRDSDEDDTDDEDDEDDDRDDDENDDDTDENSDEDDADDERDDDDDDDDEDDEDEDDEEDSNDNDTSAATNEYTPSQSNDNFTELGYISVTLQHKNYPFTIAENNYGHAEIKPTLDPLANGNHFLSLTGYYIDNDNIDIPYGVFILEIDNVNLREESGWYPIKRNILTNSKVNPQLVAYVTVVDNNGKKELNIEVANFQLTDRSGTQIYQATINAHYVLDDVRILD